MFTPSNMLESYLCARPRDMFDIVGALMGYINADPAFRSNDFDQAVQYVLDHGVSGQELFAVFDKDIEFNEDPSKWNEEYYSYARVYLKDNFCEKRIAHVKAVARKLYPTDEPMRTAAPVNTGERSTVQKNTQSGSTDSPVKKVKSQQYPVGGQSTVPTVTKVVIAATAIVLLALVAGLLVMGR